MNDAEELELLRRRLVRAERKATVAEVAAAMAHELKNPLAPIQGYAQMLRARLDRVDAAERPRFEEGLEIIEQEARRMGALLRTFLEDAHQLFAGSNVTTRFPLVEVVADAVRLVRGRAPDVQFASDGLENLAEVLGDADLVRSALVNILDNALDAVGDSGGRVEIFGWVEGDRQIVEVRDNGPGFGEDAPRFVRPFVTSKRTGTGLGLALAAASVESLGGDLSLGNGESGGASVRIQLPVAASRSA